MRSIAGNWNRHSGQKMDEICGFLRLNADATGQRTRSPRALEVLTINLSYGVSAVAALLVTIIVEGLVSLWILRPRKPRRQLIVDVAIVNLFTNPLANWASLQGVSFSAIEAVVLVVEAALFARFLQMTVVRALGLSLLLNGVTAALSFLPVWSTQ